MIGNDTLTQVSLVTDPFQFIDYGMIGMFVSGWFLCRRPDCVQCLKCPEVATIHHDCFKVFLQRYMTAKSTMKMTATTVDPMDSLWRFAAWRVPWKHAPPLLLAEDSPRVSQQHTLEVVSSRYSMPQLSKIPPELVLMIKKHSEEALLWRITAAMDLADRIIDTPLATLLRVPVSEITSWHRGGALILAQDDAASSVPILRLAIDSRGIRSVERFSEDQLPTFCPNAANRTAYVVKHVDCFIGSLAIFQVSYLWKPSVSSPSEY